jgi:uncharacterized membrane protein
MKKNVKRIEEKMRNKILCLTSIFIFMGCTYSKSKNKEASPQGLVTCSSEIDYQLVHSKIIQPKCLACHGAGAGNIELNSYATVSANFSSVLSAVLSNRMPKGNPLGSAEKEILQAWADAGLPETVAAQGSADCNADNGDVAIVVPVLVPSFDSIDAMILKPRCTACHDEFNEYDFTSYEKIIQYKNLFKVKDGKDSHFVEAVASGFMPPKNSPKLTEAEVSIIRQWVLLGLPRTAGGPPGLVFDSPAVPTVPVPVVPPLPATGDECDVIGFTEVSERVLQMKCVGCHGKAGGVNLETYASVKNHLSQISQVLNSDRMPPKNPLDPELKKLVLQWIDQGAPENPQLPSTCDPLPTPPVQPVAPLEATYNSMKTHFLEAKCIVCHSGTAQQLSVLKKSEDHDIPDFSTYAKMIANKGIFNLKKPHKSEIIEVVLDGEMPPPKSGVNPLTSSEIQALIQWVEDGLPEGKI